MKNFPRQCDGAFAPSSESSRATNESVVQKNNELVLEEQKLSLLFALAARSGGIIWRWRQKSV